jgi:Ca-activated chloride channel family protein
MRKSGMVIRAKPAAFLVLFAASCVAQLPNGRLNLNPPPEAELERLEDMSMLMIGGNDARKRQEGASDSVSKVDLKAPGAARRQYNDGVRFLLLKSLDRAVERLTKCIAIYPSYVAAHNALGSVYLELGQNEQAQKEFAQAVALDDHLPYSYLNLGWSQLALKDYPAAQESIEKASALAPLDLHLLTAQTYAQFLNHDYSAAIASAQQVHGRKHESAAIVHYLAAAAWQGQNNLEEAQKELQRFLDEDPKSPAADAAWQMIERIKNQKDQPPATSLEIQYSAVQDDSRGRRILQQLEEQKQVAEVESEPESVCAACAAPNPAGSLNPDSVRTTPSGESAGFNSSPFVLRSSVNEVAVFFAATDHGKSVSDLTRQEVAIRDDGKPPASVIVFRSESQLPLRLGLVIDTSSSVTEQFAYEQRAASSFLQKVVTDKDDLGFVVGFSNVVLLVQDFTGDKAKISRGVDQLAPAGGTALWDAVKFASDKLANRPEQQPVARILVLISDGEDNSSGVTLKQAIENAEREEVIVYTVSTRQFASGGADSQVADQALKALAERTGGAAFFPDSTNSFDRRLADLQQVIRSRYLISYRPAHFETDGRYRSITIAAQKSGHKLHVYARRGYYARANTAEAHF